MAAIAEIAARTAHETNRKLQEALGEEPSPGWDNASMAQRASMIRGVLSVLIAPNITPQEQHEAWVHHKLLEGWRYGPVKDDALKTHPCMVAYEDLDSRQRAKDQLFQAVVKGVLAAAKVIKAEAKRLAAEAAADEGLMLPKVNPEEASAVDSGELKEE